MEPKWVKRPTSLNEIPDGTEIIISIDETGTPNLKPVQKAIARGIEPDESEKAFTITACALKIEDYVKSLNSVYDLKCKYWDYGYFDYGDDDIRRVCFHSREIRRKEGPFHPDVIDYPSFINDLSEVIVNIPMVLFASHVNKVNLVKRYCDPVNPYHLCLDFVLERIVLANPKQKNCVIALESRGKKEDRFLLEHINNVLQHGTRFISANKFSCINGIYFNTKWSEEDERMKSSWQLELSDLCAYPIARHCANGIDSRAFKAIENKLYNYPNYLGYGLKVFP
ncbi:MAG: hypothetical protein IJ601_04600 [Acidaminococcaceae bacterium]|nr:hypothetical protein [Acidaminococcaceae bacterium]